VRVAGDALDLGLGRMHADDVAATRRVVPQHAVAELRSIARRTADRVRAGGEEVVDRLTFDLRHRGSCPLSATAVPPGSEGSADARLRGASTTLCARLSIRDPARPGPTERQPRTDKAL